MSTPPERVREREVAKRAFAAEFNDAHHQFKEGDDERAPVYTLLPTGERVNRVFVAGTLTDTEDMGNDLWRAVINDGTGNFYVYAGRYSPEVAAEIGDAEPPEHVAVVGKVNVYEEEGDHYVSIRPESFSVVDKATRREWMIDAAERTLERLQRFDDGDGDDVERAREEYGDDVSEYRAAATDALSNLADGD